MAVTKQEVNPTEKANTDKDIRERTEDVAEALFNNLEFPSDDPNNQNSKTQLDTDEDEKKEEPKEEPEQEEEEEEVQSEEEEEQEEDVVPVSKMKKRIDSEVAKRKILEAELAEAKAHKQDAPVDSRKAKLEGMTVKELKSLKYDAMREFKQADDATRETQLIELMDEIDDVVRTQPNKFAERQVAEYNKSANKIQVDEKYENVDFQKSSKDIKDIAVSIYQKYPELQKLERGQAVALEMAVEHFATVKTSSKGDSEKLRLKQQNKKLKRKTSLDVGSKQGNMSQADLKKKRSELRREGNTIKRAEFVESLLDVDRYLPDKLKGK